MNFGVSSVPVVVECQFCGSSCETVGLCFTCGKCKSGKTRCGQQFTWQEREVPEWELSLDVQGCLDWTMLGRNSKRKHFRCLGGSIQPDCSGLLSSEIQGNDSKLLLQTKLKHRNESDMLETNCIISEHYCSWAVFL